MNVISRARHGALLAACTLLLIACSSPPRSLPGPIEYVRSPAAAGLSIGNAAASPQRPTETVVSELPTPPVGQSPPRPPTSVASTPAPDDEDVSMAIEQTPLPMFIQILFGNVLKMPYSMDQAVNARTDIVTFKTSRPIARSKLKEVGISLLRSYQLSVQDLGGVIRIVPESAQGAPQPILRSGKSLPETPPSLRQIYQHVELDVIKSSEIGQFLRQILGSRVNIIDDVNRNGFLMSGTEADLRLALTLIGTLDQPRLRGKVAKRITPAFMAPTELGARLNDVLTAQGYGVAVGQGPGVPILIIPVPAIGSLIVFTTSEEVMNHVLRWVRELDRPLSAQTQTGIYTYAVKYADAQELAKTLGDILTGGSIAPVAAPAPAGQSGQLPGGVQAPRPSVSNSRVVVNSPTNTLIIRGTSAEEYQQIMALLRELDRPVKSAMIEVVVAELSLGASKALGVEWNLNSRSSGPGQRSAFARLASGAGLTLGFSNSAGTITGILNTLASNNQARILSNPKVMARNGETASIQVGSEVPVVTSQQSTGGTGGLFGGAAGVLQTIQYRSTGVILRVRPVINSGNRLDLEVSQEVSSAAATSTGVSASPTIQTRRIETKLSLRDGSTVLLGGLISRNDSDGTVGIPYLKDIPGLGALFGTQSDNNSQVELLIMITPYVISDDFESEAITEAILKSFGEWAQDLHPAKVMPQTNAPGVSLPTAPPVSRPDDSSTLQKPLAPRSEPQRPTLANPQGLPAPATSEPSSSAPAPAVAPSSSAPAPASAAAAESAPKSVVDQGVTMSRPDPATASKPPAETPVNPAPAVPSAASPSAARPTPGKQPIQPGKQVTDPEIRKEIEDLLKRQAPR